MGFPDSSVGKESASSAGDPSLIPGSGRSAGEGIGDPIQCWTHIKIYIDFPGGSDAKESACSAGDPA